jgi:type IV secretory pathway TrbF-like protein
MRKIADKENSKQGMLELYQLTKRQPTLNLDEYLSKATPFFREYVERQLSEVSCAYVCKERTAKTCVQLKATNGVYLSGPDAGVAQMSAVTRHSAALAALDAKAQQPVQKADDGVVFTLPEVIDMYNGLQELRRSAGLPMTNVCCAHMN